MKGAIALNLNPKSKCLDYDAASHYKGMLLEHFTLFKICTQTKQMKHKVGEIKFLEEMRKIINVRLRIIATWSTTCCRDGSNRRLKEHSYFDQVRERTSTAISVEQAAAAAVSLVGANWPISRWADAVKPVLHS